MAFVPEQDFALNVAKGVVTDTSHVNKFGRGIIDNGETWEVWDGNAAYVYPATALMTSLSQTADQVAMRGATIELMGLDASWDLVTQTAVLGNPTTTVVTLETALIRCFRMKVLADVKGDSPIRCHNAGETQDYAVISVDKNQTQMAIYTVPNGKTGYITNYWAHHNPVVGLDPTSNPLELWASDRDNLYAAQLKHGVGVPTDGGFRHPFDPYLGPFTQKTDIFITSSPVGKNADISAGFDIILVDN